MKKYHSKTQCNLFKEYLSFDDVLIKPRFSDIAFDEIDISITISKNFILKIPIIASPMDTVCGSDMAIALGKMGGLGIIHRNQTIESQIKEIKKVLKHSRVGGAVGISGDLKDRTKALAKAGASIICVDYSIGHSKQAIEAAKYIKTKYHIEVITGNITTQEAIQDYLKKNVRMFRFGISNSPICLSQKISGVGMPLFSAILNIKPLSLKEKNIFVIADGGIRSNGDIVKALAAGAHAVMLGSMLAGTRESPGKTINIDEKLYKKYRGMGSLSAMKKGSYNRYNQQNLKSMHPEGIEKLVEYRGSVQNIVENIVYGIKSAMLKIGVKNITELQKKTEFIRVSRYR
ncbi:MAG: guanosine monophosphate reductase [Candidatus Paceibacterota bacterium]